MNLKSIQAHFDGERILLDEPIELEPNTKLIVTVLPKRNAEHEAWSQMSRNGLAYAYDESEEEYPLDLIKEANPEYEGG